jgi:predicted Zn finger-like uncharacterized protein
MIIQCPDCTTRYELDASRVPEGRIRVRCARCRYVFPIEAGAAGGAPMVETPVAEDPGVTQDAWSSGAQRNASAEVPVEPMETVATPDRRDVVEVEPMAGMETTRIEDAEVPLMDPGLDLEIERPNVSRERQSASHAPVSEEPVATATMTEEPAADAVSADDQKARRLARALVSDILVYNREKRDKALAEGTLVQALGQEIKKSWELYKERVTPEAANSTNFFKEALNDILADGQKIF